VAFATPDIGLPARTPEESISVKAMGVTLMKTLQFLLQRILTQVNQQPGSRQKLSPGD
jgi:hypothetical protein